MKALKTNGNGNCLYNSVSVRDKEQLLSRRHDMNENSMKHLQLQVAAKLRLIC